MYLEKMSLPPFVIMAVIFVIFMFFPLVSLADETTASQWNQVVARIKLPNNWRFYLDTQPRFDLEPSESRGHEGIRQWLVRPAIGYSWTRYLETYVGYTLIENYSPHKTEHNVIEDINYTRPILGIKTLQRLRAEHRFFETDGEVAHRVRYLYQAVFPLSSNEDVFLVLNDEVFFNLNDVSARTQSGFTENRAFGGVAVKFMEDHRLAAGYMNQYREGRGDAGDSMNHILMLAAILNYDWST